MGHKILAVQNYGPSGSTLVQSLLDGHPEIISLPGLHALELVRYWDAHANLPHETFIESFLERFKFYYTPELVPNDLGLREIGESRNELACIKKEIFIEKIKQYFGFKQISFAEYLVAVYRSYHETLGRVYDENAYLLYPIHSLNKKFADIIKNNFSEIKFLYTIREPIQAMGSLAKHINKYDFWDHNYLLTCIAAQMICDHTIHVGPHDVHGTRPYYADTDGGEIQSRAIRLEDIHARPKETLEKICRWLNIQWNDSLLLSTFNGKTWHNRPESIRQTGFGQATITQNHSEILTKFDKYRIAFLTNKLSSHFRYAENKKYSYQNKLLMLILILMPFRVEMLRDRRARQFQKFRSTKNNRRLTRYIPNMFDNFIISSRNLMNGIKCRFKWLIPALFSEGKMTEIGYVELL